MNVVYLDPAGQVRAGWLTCAKTREGDQAPALLSPTGAVLRPEDVLSLLVPQTPTDDQRAALWRAHRAGFRLEAA